MTGTLTITIKLGNDAMQTNDDIAWALQQTTMKIAALSDDTTSGRIFDENGNRVGEWHVCER